MNQPASTAQATTGSMRDSILTEAARALNRRGVADTGLSDIAGAVGVTRAALYYYFTNQEDLVFQSYRHSCEVLSRQLSAATAVGSGGDALSIIARFVDAATDPEAPETATLCEVACLGPEKREAITRLYEGVVAKLGDIIQRGVERGEIRRCDPRLAAMAAIGLVSWIPLQKRWTLSAAFTHADLAGAVKSLILEGVAADQRQEIPYSPIFLRPAGIPSQDVFDGRVLAMAKQEVLLAVASRLFNLKGFDSTSLDEIAREVGVTKKVIYHNIGGKQALLIACNLRSLALAISLTERSREGVVDDLQALCRLIHAHVEARLRDDLAPLSGAGGLGFLPPESLAVVNEHAIRLFEAAQAVVGGPHPDGSLRGVDHDAFLMIIPGLVEWIPKWLSAQAPAERQLIASELTNFCAFGLRPMV